MRLGLRCIAAAVVLLALTQTAAGQTYPDKVIKIVVPAPPGGGLDVLMRAVAHELAARWEKSIVIDNRPGGGGLIAGETVANAPADGYTLLAVTDQMYLANRFAFKSLPYDPDKSFASVTIITYADQFLVATSSVAASSIRDIVDLEQKKPGSLAYGYWGEGSSPHLVYETLNKMLSTKFLGVPYKGVAPVVSALSSGEVQLSVMSAGMAGPMVRAGKMKFVAVAANDRNPMALDVPTTLELGFPTLQAFTWMGLAVPRNVPAAIVQKLSNEIRDIVRRPEFANKYITSQGWRVTATTPEEMDATIARQLPMVRKMILNAGVQPQ